MRPYLFVLALSACGGDKVCKGLPDGTFCTNAGIALVCEDEKVTSSDTCAAEQTCIPDVGCSDCSVAFEVPGRAEAVYDVGLTVPTRTQPLIDGAFAWQQHELPSITLTGTAKLTLSLEGAGVTVYDATGAALSLPRDLAPSDLPLQLWLDGNETLGTASLVATGEGCAEPATLPLRPARTVGLAGRSLDQFPFFEDVSAFFPDDTVEFALDPARYPELAGVEAEVYVVAHRDDPSTWLIDPTLLDVADGPLQITLGGASLSDAIAPLWSSDLPSGGVLGRSYDLVVDLDADGKLSAADLVQGLSQPAFTVLSDLTEPGPSEVVTDSFSQSTWITQRVYYPADLSALVAAHGPRPLVVISHGNGHEYTWYDWLGEHLASWGYVVMAHRNNTQPGIQSASTTTINNTDALLIGADTVFEGALAGNIDPHRIVWMGHSRGGEGILRGLDRIVEGETTPQAYTADDIILLSSIAPTAFEGPNRSDPHDKVAHLIAGSADTDVTGGVSDPSVQYYRDFQNGTATHLVTYVQGANHNDFNCCGQDPPFGQSGPRIGRQAAQHVAKAYLLGLIVSYTGGAPGVADLHTRSAERFLPPGSEAVVAIMHRPRAVQGLAVVDDFQSAPELETASSGATVVAAVSGPLEGALNDKTNTLTWNENDPMNGMTWATDDSARADRGLAFGWANATTGAPATIRWALPDALADQRTAGAISLRVAQTSRYPDNTAPLSFAVALTDKQGNRSQINVGTYGRVTLTFPRPGEGQGTGWSNEFNTVRVPLQHFTADGRQLDLGSLASVELLFGEDFGQAAGHLGLDDLMFVPEER